MNDEDFYDDSQIGLEVNGKRWAGKNYGFQSEESYNKLFVQGKLNPAQQAIDRATSSFTNLPGIKQGLQFIGGATKFVYQQLPEPVQQAAEFAAAKNQEAAENIAAATGLPVALTDPTTIADVITGGATLATKPAVKTALRETVEGAANLGRNLPPPGGAPQLAMTAVGDPQLTMRGGSVNLQPPTVNKLTLRDPANIPEGIKKGSALKDPVFAPQMRDFYQRRANIKERLQAAADRKSRRVGKLKEEGYNTISTGPSRAPELDPEAYGDKKAFEQFKEQSEITPLTPSGNVKWQQQHHMFSKQESYQFVERMIELGDDDDVLALFIMAEDMDAVMGGRLSNMLNMEDLPHSILHGSRITDKRQLKSAAMRNLVENAKSPDELMRMFRKYVTENVQPSKEEARAFKTIGQRLLKANKFGDLEQIRDKMYR